MVAVGGCAAAKGREPSAQGRGACFGESRPSIHSRSPFGTVSPSPGSTCPTPRLLPAHSSCIGRGEGHSGCTTPEGSGSVNDVRGDTARAGRMSMNPISAGDGFRLGCGGALLLPAPAPTTARPLPRPTGLGCALLAAPGECCLRGPPRLSLRRLPVSFSFSMCGGNCARAL